MRDFRVFLIMRAFTNGTAKGLAGGILLRIPYMNPGAYDRCIQEILLAWESTKWACDSLRQLLRRMRKCCVAPTQAGSNFRCQIKEI
jgi:hypothetical protein